MANWADIARRVDSSSFLVLAGLRAQDKRGALAICPTDDDVERVCCLLVLNLVSSTLLIVLSEAKMRYSIDCILVV